MNPTDALELLQGALWTAVVVSGPPVTAAMIIGIVIALFQALTQIQEATLTFIPKIMIMLAVIFFSGAFIGSSFGTFSDRVYGRIESGFP